MKDSCVRGTTENTAESKSQSICCTCGNCYLTDINPLSCCQQSIGCINILKEYREGTVTIDHFCERGIVYEDKPCITDLTVLNFAGFGNSKYLHLFFIVALRFRFLIELITPVGDVVFTQLGRIEMGGEILW